MYLPTPLQWKEDNVSKSYKLNKLKCGLSRAQIIILVLAIIVSALLFGTGYNVRKLDSITVHVQTPGLMDIISPQAQYLVKIKVENPTLIPFTILPFTLELIDSDSLMIAKLTCCDTTRIRIKSVTGIPLSITFENGFKLSSIPTIIKKGASIQGTITASTFGFKRTIAVRKEYALPKLF